MARLGPLHRLGAAFVRSCRTPGVFIDGGGMRLRVMPNGSRSWIMRITVQGVRRDMSLGPLARLSLAAARERATEIRAAIVEGRDPVADRQMLKAPSRPRPPDAVATSQTFAACWTSFWRTKEPQLSNGKHRDQWVATMDTYVLPQIGQRPIADIRPGEIIELLWPLWQAKVETARCVLQRVDAVFVAAITREWRDKANPCTGVARELGPRRRDRIHHAAMPYAEVGAFLRDLRLRQGPPASRMAFEFLILTATRSGEARGAAWTEIDLGGAQSVAQGGSFLQGFAGSAAGALGGFLAGESNLVGQYGDGDAGKMLARALISGAAGCAGAIITGGKCAEAAVTAAFASLWNGDGPTTRPPPNSPPPYTGENSKIPPDEWKWDPNSGNSRGGVWRNPGGYFGNWDPEGHWDIEPPKELKQEGQERQRYNRWGQPISKSEAHGEFKGPIRYPIPRWPSLPLIIMPPPCVVSPSLCRGNST